MTSALRRPPSRIRGGAARGAVDAVADGLAASVAYLPVVLMGLLALGTWWLVRNTPVPEAPRESGPPRGEPDYTMERFQVQRFGPDGRLRAQIDGDRVRHFPHTDTLLIDAPRVRTIDPQGRVTLAQARVARSNGDASEIRLEGAARVIRQAHAGAPAIEFAGDDIEASRTTQQIVSRKPVTVTRDGTVIRADSVVYDHAASTLTATGQVRASFAPRVTHNRPPAP
jgi:lipopolysaccharide export system protein LptC